MTIDELIDSGIVEQCSSLLGGDEDLVQDVYLSILEAVDRHGLIWLAEKHEKGWLKGYVYVMCRNSLYSRRSDVRLFEDRGDLDELDSVEDRLDYIWMLEEVSKFLSSRPYEALVLEGWLQEGSFRKLSKDILRTTGGKITHQSLYHTWRSLVTELKDYLDSKGIERDWL